MGQQDVINVLKSEPNRWFTVKDLHNKVNNSRSALCTNIKRLRDANEVHFVIQKDSARCGSVREYLYKFKRVQDG